MDLRHEGLRRLTERVDGRARIQQHLDRLGGPRARGDHERRDIAEIQGRYTVGVSVRVRVRVRVRAARARHDVRVEPLAQQQAADLARVRVRVRVRVKGELTLTL